MVKLYCTKLIAVPEFTATTFLKKPWNIRSAETSQHLRLKCMVNSLMARLGDANSYLSNYLQDNFRDEIFLDENGYSSFTDAFEMAVKTREDKQYSSAAIASLVREHSNTLGNINLNSSLLKQTQQWDNWVTRLGEIFEKNSSILEPFITTTVLPD